ncbi:MAG: hypothetical protein E7099_09130 [Mediterranea massiliensis]|nr:hypothetical protein [Mediterranea massiliensis]
MLVIIIAIFAGIGFHKSQKTENRFIDLAFENIEAEAHTVGCESYGQVLYYCIDYSIIGSCFCAIEHRGHAKSYCPDKLCE